MSYSYQRESILRVLHESDKHYSIEEIHNKLLKKDLNISLMTVYRNLKKLVNKGHVSPFHIDNVMHFCGNRKVHYHMHCVGCGNIEDVYNKKMNNILFDQVKSKNFSPFQNGVIVKGFCGDCKSEEIGYE